MHRILRVVIEYSPRQKRVMVRGVWLEDQPTPPPIEAGNKQNVVRVFEGIDMGRCVGFVGLVPDPED